MVCSRRGSDDAQRCGNHGVRPVSRRIAYIWNGEAWEPEKRFRLICQAEFGEGEVRWLEEVFDRSPESHKHYFACLNTAWKNLPEEIALEYPTVDRLRKKALLATGQYTVTFFPCDSMAEAYRWAEYMAKTNPDDEISVSYVRDKARVERRVADSQSYKAMTKRKFQESKDKVLDYVSKLIGVTSDELSRNAGRAA